MLPAVEQVFLLHAVLRRAITEIDGAIQKSGTSW